MSTVMDRPSEVIDESVEILDNGFPAKVWIGCHPITNRYACYCSEGLHGLGVSSSEGGIIRLLDWIELSGMSTKEVTFEEACAIAMGRPEPITGIMLVDSLRSPKFIKLR
jgi:hypothetical protein